MPIGIAAPNPSGLPGFNQAYGLRAGAGGGIANARPLPSWYNVVTTVVTAADSFTLPPAYAPEEVTVSNTAANSCTVFGNVNPQGVQDTILVGGAQVTTGVAVAANATAIFWCLTPQAGFTNAPIAGTWQYKILP